MAAPGIRIVFNFGYRATSTEEWSQLYHLDSDFADLTDFTTTLAALKTALTACLSNSVGFVRAYGYHDTDDPSAYEATMTGTGSLALSGSNIRCPGDCAAWCRWYTERLTSRGRKIYLRKYFHGVFATSSSSPDQLASSMSGPLAGFAAAATGTGWNGKHLAGPDGLVPGGGSAVSTYVGFRQLKRR